MGAQSRYVFLAGDGAIGRGEGCGRLERPLARFELERTREQKKPYSQSVRPGIDILSRFLNYQHSKIAHVTQAFFSSDAQLFSCYTTASPTIISLPVFISLYLSLSSLQQQMRKRLYFSTSSIRPWSAPTTQEYCSERHYSTPA